VKYLLIAAATLAMAGPALAESHASGDAAAGEEAFNRQCIACHVVANEAGDVIAGRNARTGPNLYGVAGRTLGSVEDFKYGKSMIEAGEKGMAWDEAMFVGYVQDPTGWLKTALDDSKARGKMAFKVKNEKDAADLYAYLVSIGPAASN